MWVEFAIVIGVIVLFIGSSLLNNKVRIPEGTKMPTGCSHCTQTTCTIKSMTAIEKKDELRNYLASLEDCPEKQEKK